MIGTIAQMGEHLLCKQVVVCSIQTGSTNNCEVVSSWVAQQAHILPPKGLAGSIPALATKIATHYCVAHGKET